MGKRKSDRGRGGGQILLDSLLKPRRSARQANIKSASGFKSQLSAKDDAKTTAFVLEPAEAEITAASTADKPKSSKHLKTRSKAEKETKIVKVDLNEEDQLELLKNFDLSPAYGPCRGISRRARYLRALHFKLQPQVSKTILDALDLHEEGDLSFQNCIWDQHQFLKTRK